MTISPMSNQVKGFIAKQHDFTYYHDGRDVYRASPGAVVDTKTGYLIGRWECSVDHWNRFCMAVYNLPTLTK